MDLAWDLPPGGEEGLEEGCAVLAEDAGNDLYLVIETRIREDFEAGTDGTALGIVSAVDEAGDAGLNDGAGTHAAGLDRDVECGAGQPIVLERSSRFADHDDFGVGRGIAVPDSAVAGASQNIAAVNDESSDGDFASCGRSAGFLNGELYEYNVGVHF